MDLILPLPPWSCHCFPFLPQYIVGISYPVVVLGGGAGGLIP